ncbi:Ankyrin repeat-containing protein [Polaromonas sp. YR568]|uniref:ankyrin repeat domain-containing protein n=1 Tax=Polaromonas sp. YR568 TaxID=1855301 RepID=UPI0008E40F9D|nr:ankyrin repeat domain-containing protein [Polaromonas sp. YR568]SFU94265.1 Ankyrin repeat-containing protein [Polaromonas sp. YR568]
MTEPDRSPPGDELTARYREASAQDTRRPGAHVRDAVRAHAEMVIAAGKAQTANAAAATPTQTPAANQSRWKISALASVALVGLTGLLVLQLDRGSDEEKDLAFGQPSASAPPAAAVPAPAPAPAAAPANTAPQTTQSEARAKAAPAESSAAAALKAPAKPAAEKPAPQPAPQPVPLPGLAKDAAKSAAKAEAETTQAFGGVAPPVVASPPAAAPSPAAAPAAPPAPPAAIAQDSAGFGRSRQADAAAGSSAVVPAPQADELVSRSAPAAAPVAPSTPSTPAAMSAPRPAVAPALGPAPAVVAAAPPAPAAAAPAAAAPAAAAPAAAEQRQEKSAAPARSLRAEATGSLALAGALQQAARAGNLQQLDRLLQQGAPVNAADSAGRTPLVLAVMQGHTAVVQRLLAAGANTALIDKDGLNALQHARRLGFDGIAHLIEAAR